MAAVRRAAADADQEQPPAPRAQVREVSRDPLDCPVIDAVGDLAGLGEILRCMGHQYFTLA